MTDQLLGTSPDSIANELTNSFARTNPPIEIDQYGLTSEEASAALRSARFDRADEVRIDQDFLDHIEAINDALSKLPYGTDLTETPIPEVKAFQQFMNWNAGRNLEEDGILGKSTTQTILDGPHWSDKDDHLSADKIFSTEAIYSRPELGSLADTLRNTDPEAYYKAQAEHFARLNQGATTELEQREAEISGLETEMIQQVSATMVAVEQCITDGGFVDDIVAHLGSMPTITIDTDGYVDVTPSSADILTSTAFIEAVRIGDINALQDAMGENCKYVIASMSDAEQKAFMDALSENLEGTMTVFDTWRQQRDAVQESVNAHNANVEQSIPLPGGN